MSFGLYLLGFVLVIAGIAWGLISAGMSHQHVEIASLILLGIGILTGVTRTRGKDRSKTPLD